MRILLVIGFLIPVVYIGYLMTRLDKFMVEGGFQIEYNEMLPVAIVLGGNDLATQVSELLQKNGIPVLNLTEPFLLEQRQSFRYLFALSEKDVDNIVLCKVAKKVYGIEKIISLCNERRNDGMFISEGISYLPTEDVTAEMIYEFVVKDTEVRL